MYGSWFKTAHCLSICNHASLCSLCPGLIIHEGSSVYRIFKRWQAVNQQWKVLNYEKSKDLDDPVSSKCRVERTSTHNGTDGGHRASQHVRTILNHRCGYTILHILSQLRPNNLHRANQEVVMRVTTVWGLETWTGTLHFILGNQCVIRMNKTILLCHSYTAINVWVINFTDFPGKFEKCIPGKQKTLSSLQSLILIQFKRKKNGFCSCTFCKHNVWILVFFYHVTYYAKCHWAVFALWEIC